MSFDITPRVPTGRQIVQAYGEGGFKITGQHIEGSVLVFLDETRGWSGELTLDGLADVMDHPEKPQILVVGCGPAFKLPPEELRAGLRARGVVLEWMDTPAACRTYNVLALEERSAAAALVAVE
ncbi:MAG: Mth938-like domain-containing protein [Alphaproteobacteria bacterium]|nr:Mth938-like domain-containing protein [Alphaproteobacteria bacterium]